METCVHYTLASRECRLPHIHTVAEPLIKDTLYTAEPLIKDTLYTVEPLIKDNMYWWVGTIRKAGWVCTIWNASWVCTIWNAPL